MPYQIKGLPIIVMNTNPTNVWIEQLLLAVKIFKVE